MPNQRHVAIMLDLQWPYKRHTEVFAGTQRFAREAGRWACTVDEYVDKTLPTRRPRRPGRLPYDGVIGRIGPELAHRAGRLGIPVVNTWISSAAEQTPSVFVDFAAVGVAAAEHLMARGFARFAFLGRRADAGHQKTLQGFTRAIRDADPDHDLKPVWAQFEGGWKAWARAKQRVEAWMDTWRPPVGVYVAGDAEGRQVAQLCQIRGWRVPHDVAIVSGQNEATLCEHPAPGLTSVEIGYEQLGYEAARLLDGLMSGQQPPTAPILKPPVGIVPRESTDFFAVDDELLSAALRFIAERAHTPISVPDVAAAVYTSRPTLERRFRHGLGRSIAAEIRRVRLERAKRQLGQSDLPIKTIARAVGLGNAKRMNDVFQRELGVTPSDYRKQRQSGG